MLDKFDLTKSAHGYVILTNEDGQTVRGDNLIVYHGGDIIAQLLAGNDEYRISHVYFAYENTAGVPTAPAAARSDTVAYFVGLTPPQDYLRAPILDPPIITAGDANHDGNRVTFNSIGSGVTGENGLAFGSASNSKVFSVALVASPTGLIASDVLYARYVLPTALPAVGSGQVSVTWATEAI